MRRSGWGRMSGGTVITTLITLAAAAALAVTEQAFAQDPIQPDDPERQAQLQRRGAGFRLGAWWVQDRQDDEPTSRWPYIEGYFQRGLDLHLALESTLSVWRQRRAFDGGRVDSYVVPLFTSLKFYPTRPDRALEPFLLGGLGLALGIEDRETEELLGPGGGTSLATGFGLKGGTGFEARFSPAFGISVGAAYNWVRFGDRIDGENIFGGPVVTAGLVYRFQF